MNLCSSKLFLRHIVSHKKLGVLGIWCAIINTPAGGAVGLLEAVQKPSVSLPVSLSPIAFSLYSVLFVLLSSFLWLHLEIGSHMQLWLAQASLASVTGVYHHIWFDFCFFTPVAL